ncbi:purine-cytosine permease family protein [Agrococcus jejuensis]|uniref:Purine-cytosine permease n=1 Tax=Agrococcus jejuensis TaxID=399736 RepID=A0A1G8A0V5_9MICO|nr:cytosine permease [Agrococcus jejuensis]SDH14559.1 Purine-cytosine permease [Agrococcus jejuensis]
MSDAARTTVTDAVGHVEARGIDVIPDDERHGRPRALFGIWAAANVLYLYLVYGGLLVMLGLGVVEALVVCLLGNLWWFGVGWLATSGPASGTPSVVILRAVFGVRGNLVFGSALGVAIGVFFAVLNITFATLATQSLLVLLGWQEAADAGVAILVGVSAVCTVLSIFGHATIERISPYLSIVVGACFVVLGAYAVGAADWSYAAPELGMGERVALWLLGFTIIASGPLSWAASADFSRYLPASSSRRAIVGWTALGGIVPSVLITAVGIALATTIDMTEPQASIAAVVPGWFHPVILAAIVVGTIANNVLTQYSNGLYAQSLAPRVPRWMAVAVVGGIGLVLSGWLLYGAPDFLETLGYLIELSVAVMGPLMAVYAADIWLRRGAFDGVALSDTSPGSRFWYSGGWHVAGAVAMVVATTVAVLMVNTTLYVGPISALLGGADLSSIVGPLLAAGIYLGLARGVRRASPAPALVNAR